MAPPFELTLKGIGVFPPRGDPTSLWAGVVDPGPVVALRHKVLARLRDLPITRDPRKFVPHVTLARTSDSPVDAVVAEHAIRDVKHRLQARQQCTEIPLGYLEEADIEVARLGPVARAAQQRADDHRDRRSSSYDRLLRDADGARSALEFAQRNVRSELGTIRALRKALAAAGVQAVLTPEMEERLAASPSRED